MNKFFISVLLLTAISISSCTNDDSLAPASSPSPVRANGVQVSVNATIEGSQHIAKTHLAYDGDLEKYLYKFDGNETMAFFCGEESYKAGENPTVRFDNDGILENKKLVLKK